MIIPGKHAVSRGIITGLRSLETQIQPCGVDLTLRHVLKYTSGGAIDFDNVLRQRAGTERLPWSPSNPSIPGHHWSLPQGSYLVEFNETVEMPLDIMSQIFVRSSLFRAGAIVQAGLMDSGYKGAIGSMLRIENPFGILLHQDARLAQMVFHQMSEKVEGYDGVYQGAKSV